MPERDLHLKPFDEGTQAKLDLYRAYLREWFPTFLNAPGIERIQVFDFFAGPGADPRGRPGSPRIAMEAAIDAIRGRPKTTRGIELRFNEMNRAKAASLREMLLKIKVEGQSVRWDVTQLLFEEAFPIALPRMSGKVANLVFIDQNGIKNMTPEVLQSVASLPRTDLLFFASSALVNRFKELPEIRKYVPMTEEDFKHLDGDHVHRILADAYRRWLPATSKYYLASFSIKKGPNVYGLVFGSGHPRGIDKFLRVAWAKGGDATYDIDKDRIDPTQPRLFPEMDRPSKLREFEDDLRTAILSGKLQTNKEVFIFGLENGVLAKHSREIIKRMMNSGELPKQFIPISYDSWDKNEPGVPIQIKA